MEHQIKSEAALRALMGEPIHPLVVAKSASVITEPLKRYIELSPFVCLGAHAAKRLCEEPDVLTPTGKMVGGNRFGSRAPTTDCAVHAA